MSTVNTRLLVADYIKYRLENKGLEWPGCPDLPNPGQVQQPMRIIGDEILLRYTIVFKKMCNQFLITPNTAQPKFVAIVNELFSEGVKWGRVVALFAFVGSLAVQCSEKEMPLLVDQIVDWVADYIDNHLQSWIIQNGNWDGFVVFYEGGAERRNESPWPSLGKICKYAVGALGVLTLGAILAQKS